MISYKKILPWMVSILAFIRPLPAQVLRADYEKKATIIYENIYGFFYDSSAHLFIETNDRSANKRPYSYLWPLCALIQAGNEMEALEPGKSYMPPVMKAIDKYFSARAPAPGYESYVVSKEDNARFYDDNQWIGIAYMDAYRRTKDKKYLERSSAIYRFMMTGYDTLTGGGLYWKEGDKTTKNTCSNGPGILLALQLYNATQERHYLDTALLLYHWTNQRLQSPQGVYYDALKLPANTIDKSLYTYNTGTMLQANAMLFAISKDRKYLAEAQRLAAASLNAFYKNGRLPPNYWFNAVLMRGYLALYELDKNKVYLQAFIRDADEIWRLETDKNKLVGRAATKKLLDQAGMLEIYARIAQW